MWFASVLCQCLCLQPGFDYFLLMVISTLEPVTNLWLLSTLLVDLGTSVVWIYTGLFPILVWLSVNLSNPKILLSHSGLHAKCNEVILQWFSFYYEIFSVILSWKLRLELSIFMETWILRKIWLCLQTLKLEALAILLKTLPFQQII